MKTDTSNKILKYVEEHREVTAHELVNYLGFSPQAVFKQLRALVEKGKLAKVGLPPKVFYHIAKFKTNNAFKLDELDRDSFNIIENNYIFITPQGEFKEGVNGFVAWCEKAKQDVAKTAKEYVKTIEKFNSYKVNGVIDSTNKFNSSFEETYLDKVYYVDFYSIERFGKTKLGALLLYAKQSQNKRLMKMVYDLSHQQIERVIKDNKIDAIGFIPPTLPRKVQFVNEFERLMSISIPKINLIKAAGEIPVAQKTLSKLDDRIENARSSIFVKGTIQYNNVLLIDDAAGSGATLNETAKKIRERGIAKNKIIGLAITGSFKGFEVLQEV